MSKVASYVNARSRELNIEKAHSVINAITEQRLARFKKSLIPLCELPAI